MADGVLARYTRDLTADARAGRLEPIRSRAEEISRVIDILLRHGKNNPALVGPSGVGKTAIVEGLAQRIAAGDVPLRLRGARVLAVDHVSLLGGTMYRGQYEDRIRGLVEETTAASDAILFIDELHNLIGQGTAIGVAMDAGNMLKPALVRGDFRVIGATTTEEYERWVGGDPALERRFQKVLVRELNAAETLDILVARKERLERHHNVVISDEAIRAAIDLTDQHQTDRMRPDRAIDALDEACAHTHAVAKYSSHAEELIRLRRDAARMPPAKGESPRSAPRPSTNGDTSANDNGEDDPIEKFARDGFAALERFGAELGSIFGGEPDGTPRERPATTSPPPAPPERAPAAKPQPTVHSLAELEQKLNQVLIEEGIVVRGPDVARVVGLATGKEVRWTASV